MMKRAILLVASVMAFALLIVFSGCTKNEVSQFYPPGETCDTVGVSYTNDILPIIDPNCYVCHDQLNHQALGGFVLLEGYTKFVVAVNNLGLICDIEHQCNPMPKGGGKLSDCEITTIKAWVNAGTPNN